MILKELLAKLQATREALAAVFEQAKAKDSDGNATLDFRQVKGLSDEIDKLEGIAKSVRVAEAVRALDDEVNDLAEQVETLEAAEKAASDFDRAERQRKRPPFPDGEEKGKQKAKSFGRRVTEHPIFKKWCEGSRDGKIVLEDAGLKTLFQTTAGWVPESIRTGRVVDAVTQPLQILDILPTGGTGQANVVYMEETTRTHAAAETAEGAAKPESTFELTERTSPVREVADSIPVTDIQLEDVAMVESYLEGRLSFGIRQRLDGQSVTGDGIAPNLTGILNVAGIQTQAKGADPVPDAFFKAGTLLRVTGRVVPTHALFHPNDWQDVRLLRTADGIYIWGSPSEAGPDRLWGWPVIQNESLTEGTGLLGSFQPAWITLFERRGIVVERGFVGTQFTQNRQTIRASGRWALVVYRPAAFATVTGI